MLKTGSQLFDINIPNMPLFSKIRPAWKDKQFVNTVLIKMTLLAGESKQSDRLHSATINRRFPETRRRCTENHRRPVRARKPRTAAYCCSSESDCWRSGTETWSAAGGGDFYTSHNMVLRCTNNINYRNITLITCRDLIKGKVLISTIKNYNVAQLSQRDCATCRGVARF